MACGLGLCLNVNPIMGHQVEIEEELLRLKEENQELRERIEQQRADLER